MEVGWYRRDGTGPVELQKAIAEGLLSEVGSPVARTVLADTTEISTVFLSLDHAFYDGPPLIFETMVFGGPHDEDIVRYSTEAKAVEGHTAMVHLLCAEQDTTVLRLDVFHEAQL